MPVGLNVMIEPMESRRLLAVTFGATASVNLDVNGVLNVVGTSGDDHIVVNGLTDHLNQHHPDPDRIDVSDVLVAKDAPTQILLNESFARTDVKSIVVWGGDGRDRLYVVTTDAIATMIHCGDGGCTVGVFNSADDVVYGGAGADRISTGGGDDSIYGGASRDVIRAGAGNDLISGGGGNDQLYGGDGRDRIYGGKGNDFIDGGLHADRLYGDAGDDVIVGGSGDDTIDGGDGNDSLEGTGGDDVFAANDGAADTLSGGGGANTGSFDHLLDLVDGVRSFQLGRPGRVNL